MSLMCRSGRSNRSKHGGRLPRLQSIGNCARQPVLSVQRPHSSRGSRASALVPNDAPERRRPDAEGQRRTAPLRVPRTPSSVLAGMRHPGHKCLGARALGPTHRRQPPFGASLEVSNVGGVARSASAPELRRRPSRAARANLPSPVPDLRVRPPLCRLGPIADFRPQRRR